MFDKVSFMEITLGFDILKTQFSWKPVFYKGYDLKHFQVIWGLLSQKCLLLHQAIMLFSFQNNLECIHKGRCAFFNTFVEFQENKNFLILY